MPFNHNQEIATMLFYDILNTKIPNTKD